MKPIGKNKIIVRFNPNQKEEIAYGTLKLVIPYRHQLQGNGRVGNPTLCEVIGSNDERLKKGDILITGHNSLNNDAWVIERDEDYCTIALPIDRWILGKLSKNGELLPMFGNVLCKRINEPPRSSIIITPDAFIKTEENKVKIVSGTYGINDLCAGDTGIIFTHADYEAWWNVNGEDHSAVVIYEEDIVAILKDAA